MPAPKIDRKAAKALGFDYAVLAVSNVSIHSPGHVEGLFKVSFDANAFADYLNSIYRHRQREPFKAIKL